MSQAAIAVTEGPDHTNYPRDTPAGTCVIVDKGGAHLPYDVQPDGTLYNSLLTRGGSGGTPENIIGANSWRTQVRDNVAERLAD